MGFGAGSALTVVPIDRMIKAQGYEAAFFKFGIAQGLVVFVLGWLLAAPPANFKVPGKGAATTAPTRDREPLQVLASPAFWIMYLMFMMTATFGLVITAQFTTMSKAFGLGDAQANVLGFTVKAVTFALAMNRVLNGVSRPFFGWVSDRLGRERTMAVAFLCEGVVIYLFGRLGADPGSLILLSGLVFFCYGEIYSLFPAACGDSYGKKFAAANAGLLYTAKGVASLFVPFSVDMASAHGWNSVYLLGASLNVVAAVMAIVLLKPARARLALAG
jgi:OFA family oxalate/formate antiporter-like MFS transporter